MLQIPFLTRGAGRQARELVRSEEERAERRAGSGPDPGARPLAPLARHPDAPEDARWDCESVLSLRSNLDNHPALLAEPGRPRRGCFSAWPDPGASAAPIRLSAKTGLPVGFTGATGAAGDGASAAGESAASSVRRRDESAEEKRERKAAVRDARVRTLALFLALYLVLYPGASGRRALAHVKLCMARRRVLQTR